MSSCIQNTINDSQHSLTQQSESDPSILFAGEVDVQEDLSMEVEPAKKNRDTTPSNHKSPSELDPYMVVPQQMIENVAILNHSTQNHSKLNKHSPKLNIIPLTKRCNIYSLKQKEILLQILDAKNGDYDAAVAHIRLTQGYEKIEAKSLKNWEKNRGCWKRRGGKAVNWDFDNDVKSLLITQAMVSITNQESLIVHANIAFSYKVIKAAALKAQQCSKWSKDPKISCMKFQDTWIHSFLKEMGFQGKKFHQLRS